MKHKKSVIIVGSGAGGAVVAYELASKGYDVTVIEEGGLVDYHGLSSNVANATIQYYRYGGAIPILSKPMIGFVEGRAFGGTTVINGGLFWRTPKDVLDKWLSDKNISSDHYDNYEIYFNEIEEKQSVSFLSNVDGNKDSVAIRNGAKKLNWDVVDVPRSLKNCTHSNRCPAVCPTNAKRSVDLTYLAAAKRFNIKVITEARAIKIKHKNRIFSSLVIQSKTESYELNSDYLFLCAGALQSPILLRNSGIKKNIGNSLSLHINLKFLVFFSHEVDSSNGTIFTQQVQEFMKEGILIMPTNFNHSWALGAVESRLPLSRTDMSLLDKHAAIITTQIRPKGKGKVRSILNMATVSQFSFVDDDYELIKKSIRLSAKLFFESGASHFYLPIAGTGAIRDLKELEQVLESSDFLQRLELISVHAMASCPMGLGDMQPVNHDGKLKGYSNIYLADASILPSNIGESPQGTIMYFAKHVAEKFYKNDMEKNAEF